MKKKSALQQAESEQNVSGVVGDSVAQNFDTTSSDTSSDNSSKEELNTPIKRQQQPTTTCSPSTTVTSSLTASAPIKRQQQPTTTCSPSTTVTSSLTASAPSASSVISSSTQQMPTCVSDTTTSTSSGVSISSAKTSVPKTVSKTRVVKIRGSHYHCHDKKSKASASRTAPKFTVSAASSAASGSQATADLQQFNTNPTSPMDVTPGKYATKDFESGHTSLIPTSASSAQTETVAVQTSSKAAGGRDSDSAKDKVNVSTASDSAKKTTSTPDTQGRVASSKKSGTSKAASKESIMSQPSGSHDSLKRSNSSLKRSSEHLEDESKESKRKSQASQSWPHMQKSDEKKSVKSMG